jgi:PAS domain S-box-containing protein
MRTLLGEAVDEATVGVVVFDENGRYLAVNRAMCRLLGYELDEFLELTPIEVSARKEKQVRRGLEEVVRHGSRSGAARLRRKDGTIVQGRYVAARTRIAHLDYYVSIFEPVARKR